MAQADPYWSYVKLLLHCEGADNDTYVSDEANTSPALSGGAKLSILQKALGNTSLYFNGTSAYAAFASETNFALSTFDFQLELRVYPRLTTEASPQVISIGDERIANQMWLVANGTANPGKYALYVGNYSTTTPLLVSTASVEFDKFVALAISRSNGVWRLFINGAVDATVSYNGSLGGVSYSVYLSSTNAGRRFFGYIDEVRLTVGLARNTSAYTVASEPFPDYGSTATDPYYDKVVLHSHFDGANNATVFSDRKGHAMNPVGSAKLSTTAKTFGSTALYISDASSGISLDSADFVLGTQDFTIECFLHPSSSWNDKVPLITLLSADNTGYALLITGSTGLENSTVVVNGTTVIAGFSSKFTVGVSNHLCVCRNGNYITVYLNGAVTAQADIGATSISGSGKLYLFKSPVFTTSWAAYWTMDELCVTKGVARYSAFVTTIPVPSVPFPNYGVSKLTGIVRDHNGNKLARTVRAYRSSDGLLVDTAVSDPVTGEFTLSAMDTSEHLVLVQDPYKNAIVYDHIVPVMT